MILNVIFLRMILNVMILEWWT